MVSDLSAINFYGICIDSMKRQHLPFVDVSILYIVYVSPLNTSDFIMSKKEIEESSQERLNLIASKEFLTQHMERIDMLRTIQKELWVNYHLEKNPT